MKKSDPHAGGLAPIGVVVFWTVVGAFFRFYHLGVQPLWFDERLALADVSRPFSEIAGHVAASPPFFHYLLSAAIHGFGPTAWAMRLVPAVFGVLAIPLFYFYLKRLFDSRAAAWGTAFLALSPFHLFFSQEARMYSLLACEAIASLYVWNEAIERGRVRFWVLFVGVSVLGLYTHNWYGFLVAGQGILTFTRREGSAKPALLAFSSIGLLYLPWVSFLIHQIQEPLYQFLPRPGLRAIRDTGHAWAGVSVPSGATSVIVPPPLIPWIHGSFLVLLIAGIVRCVQLPATRRMLLGGWILPWAGVLLVSQLKSFYHPGRYTLLFLPAVYACVASAFSADASLRARRIQITLATVWMSGCGLAMWLYFTDFLKQ